MMTPTDPNLPGILRKAAKEIETLTTRVAELERVLKPFADKYKHNSAVHEYQGISFRVLSRSALGLTTSYTPGELQVGDFERAYQVYYNE